MTQLRSVAIAAGSRVSPQLFQSLGLTRGGCEVQPRGATFAASIALHSALAAALAVLPILLGSPLPSVGAGPILDGAILEIRVLPPPPASNGQSATTVRSKMRPRTNAIVAPSDVPNGIQPDDLPLDLGGRPDGIPGGVPDLPEEAKYVGVVSLPDLPPQQRSSSERVVRIGGLIATPKLLERIEPRFPELALASRVSALVVLEAEVDTSGHVRAVKVLRGHPLFDQPSLDAVKQWRYQPLLLNGEPTGFVLTVTLTFRLQNR